jgi:hypothetical protein
VIAGWGIGLVFLGLVASAAWFLLLVFAAGVQAAN